MDRHSPSSTLARRYVAWVRRHSLAIIGAHVAVLLCSLYLIAFHLPLFADFSYLLPQDAPAVRDLRRLEARVNTPDIVLANVEAPPAPARAAATADLARELQALPRDLVARVDADDTEQ